ncbi:MAG: hypothetical protein LBL66_10630 [Clostridiales bacterium]|jgi:hypothetical protein|nr:hypothetical protein [Clostridiales bacterium]
MKRIKPILFFAALLALLSAAVAACSKPPADEGDSIDGDYNMTKITVLDKETYGNDGDTWGVSQEAADTWLNYTGITARNIKFQYDENAESLKYKMDVNVLGVEPSSSAADNNHWEFKIAGGLSSAQKPWKSKTVAGEIEKNLHDLQFTAQAGNVFTATLNGDNTVITLECAYKGTKIYTAEFTKAV